MVLGQKFSADQNLRDRSKRKSPRWTWILLSEGQILAYYTKGTSRTKIRLSHVKIIVFRRLIWAVECLY